MARRHEGTMVLKSMYGLPGALIPNIIVPSCLRAIVIVVGYG
jgi:hypothetical protein